MSDDDDFTSAARKDLAFYTLYLASGDDHLAARIEKKYSLYGLSPQHVSEELADIAAKDEEQHRWLTKLI